jgi:hypothetical protein
MADQRAVRSGSGSTGEPSEHAPINRDNATLINFRDISHFPAEKLYLRPVNCTCVRQSSVPASAYVKD